MAQGGARFTTRYTALQKEALLRAVCIDRMTVADAVRAAAAGELGLPAFEINRQYAYDILKKDRDAFEAGNEEALEAAIDHELRGAEIDALAQIRKLRKRGRESEVDTARLALASKDLVAIRKARREAGTNTQTTKTKPPSSQSAQPSNAQAKSDATLSDLLDLAGQSGNKPVKGGRESGSVSRPPIDDAEDLAS